MDRDEDTRKHHLIPFLRGKLIGEITGEMVDRYIAQRRDEGAALGTIQRELVCLKHMLNLARRSGVEIYNGTIDLLITYQFSLTEPNKIRYFG